MRLLNNNSVKQLSIETADLCRTVITVDSDIRSETLIESIAGSKVVEVRFLSSADGRAFSLPRYLRDRLHFEGKIFASGKINPDQLSMALQCGFTGVLVGEEDWIGYGESAWLAALRPQVSYSYAASHSDSVMSIWTRRQEHVSDH